MLATLSGADLVCPKVESVPCVEGGKTKSLPPKVSPGGAEGRVIVIEVWGGWASAAARAVVAEAARKARVVVRSCIVGVQFGRTVEFVEIGCL